MLLFLVESLGSQLTDIGVLQVLEEGDLPDGGAGRALLVLQPDLLEGHDGVGQPGLALVHRGVGALQHETLDKFQSTLCEIIKIVYVFLFIAQAINLGTKLKYFNIAVLQYLSNSFSEQRHKQRMLL